MYQTEKKATAIQKNKIKNLCELYGKPLEDYLFLQTRRVSSLGQLYSYEAAKIIKNLLIMNTIEMQQHIKLKQNIYAVMEAIAEYVPKLKNYGTYLDKALIDHAFETKTELGKAVLEMNNEELKQAEQIAKGWLKQYIMN